MARFIEGLDRDQTSLLPACIDDYVDDQNPVRAIDAFVDMLDLAMLNFDAEAKATGRPTLKHVADRDGVAHTRLQYDARNRDHRWPAPARSDEGVMHAPSERS